MGQIIWQRAPSGDGVCGDATLVVGVGSAQSIHPDHYQVARSSNWPAPARRLVGPTQLRLHRAGALASWRLWSQFHHAVNSQRRGARQAVRGGISWPECTGTTCTFVDTHPYHQNRLMPIKK